MNGDRFNPPATCSRKGNLNLQTEDSRDEFADVNKSAKVLVKRTGAVGFSDDATRRGDSLRRTDSTSEIRRQCSVKATLA